MSIEQPLLDRIDRAARSQGLSRSAYLAQVAARDLAGGVGPGREPSVRQALRELDDLLAAAPAGEAVRDLRAEREAR